MAGVGIAILICGKVALLAVSRVLHTITPITCNPEIKASSFKREHNREAEKK